MSSEYQELLEKLLNSDTTDVIPQSRAEYIMLTAINSLDIDTLPEPNSRMEAYLMALITKMGEGGGASGYIKSPTHAAVGQTIKVSAVDENGQPTEWEAVDMASGGAWHTIGKQTMDGVETAVSFDANGETIVQIVVAGTPDALNATKATVSLTHQSGKTFDFCAQTLNSTKYFPKNVFLIVGETKCRQMIFVKAESVNYDGNASFAIEQGHSGDKKQYTERDPITKITITFDVAPVSGAVVRMEGM